MAYKSPPAPHPLGMHRPTIEERRRELGLTPSGFKEGGGDLAGAEKEAMERELLMRADANLPEGLGGAGASTDDDPR
ncbi:hypothetical protein SAMN05444398_1011062 [Roseovarius pacificus]|uniref:Uncharacterized protein n=1 Tax=Roseovarius pacificus TaxID=337701 RepID=A0A1M6YWL2_9RHOB|nr:hypothetical protein GCM10011315_00720 [Roseovarius pacificus]SHL22462.1 hypothetical protein SAMN05444398_1011062 [Roseovarius pacificus]